MKYLVFFIKSIITLLFVVHFAFVAVYLSPDNPIKHQYNYRINSYVNPFFSQSWNLFAPDPVASNNKILYQFKIFNKSEIVKTNWLDVTTPMDNERKTKFMSPSLRILRHFASIYSDIAEKIGESNKITEDDLILKKDSIKALALKELLISKSDGHKTALQYSVFVANNYIKSNNLKYDSIQVSYLIVFEIFPRFSKRNLDYYDKKNYTYNSYTSKYFRIL